MANQSMISKMKRIVEPQNKFTRIKLYQKQKVYNAMPYTDMILAKLAAVIDDCTNIQMML